MELVNKFDNALSGVAGDDGATGVARQRAPTSSRPARFWDMQHCDPGRRRERTTTTQLAAPDIGAGQQDALFGAIGQVFGLLNLRALPLYPPPHHCNTRGLTDLGEHTIDGLAERHMLFDPDHMSVKARNAAARPDRASCGYPGVISSHSWSTPDAYPRIYEAGGFIAPYAGDSTGFVEKWRRHLGWADPRYYWGIGYGADINGLGAQGDPRGADVAQPGHLPVHGPRRRHGRPAARRRAGLRHQRRRRRAVRPLPRLDRGPAQGRRPRRRRRIVDDMSRGAEAYLQMWERAEGIAPDSCRNPGPARSVRAVTKLARAAA